MTEIEREVERLRSLGMNFDREDGPGRPVDVKVVKLLYGRDPEGNLIEIQETLEGSGFGAELLPKADLVGKKG